MSVPSAPYRSICLSTLETKKGGGKTQLCSDDHETDKASIISALGSSNG